MNCMMYIVQIPLKVINVTGISNEDLLQVITEVQTKVNYYMALIYYIIKILQKHWIILHQFDYTNKYLTNLLISKCNSSKNEGLWLSIDVNEVTKVPSILKYCYRIALDEPKVYNTQTVTLIITYCIQLPINSLIHFLHICGQDDVLSTSPRPEWLPLLHSICMVHIGLLLRQLCCKWSFQCDYKWNHTHLMVYNIIYIPICIVHCCVQDALNFVIGEFKSSEIHVPGKTPNSASRSVSWSGIRYMISQVIL